MNPHPTSDVQTDNIGEGTRVWQFCVVLAEATIGGDCNICSHCFIENDVVIGDRVTVKCGVQIWDGITIEDDVFIGPNATFTNDFVPRSRQIPREFARTTLKKSASIGANATILPGLTIGEAALVGAGSVVTKDVPAFAVVVGSPARLVGWICRCGSRLKLDSSSVECECGLSYELRDENLHVRGSND
jgi:acetyltransferase-like isoleucine patch superfamily enzyme